MYKKRFGGKFSKRKSLRHFKKFKRRTKSLNAPRLGRGGFRL